MVKEKKKKIEIEEDKDTEVSAEAEETIKVGEEEFKDEPDGEEDEANIEEDI